MILSIGASSVISNADRVKVASGTLSLPDGSYVVHRETCDINADGENEDIYVYAHKKSEEDVFCEDVNIAVIDAEGLLRRTNYSGVSGSILQTCISDFNGDGKKDILVILNNGDKHMCIIGDFAHSIPKNIISAKDLKGLQMKLHFIDGFAVSAELENGQMFSVNVSAQKEVLKKKGFFSDDGKYLNGTPVISEIMQIKPVDHDFGSNLIFTQKLYIKEDNTYLCSIDAEMEYTGDTLLVKRIDYYTQNNNP